MSLNSVVLDTGSTINVWKCVKRNHMIVLLYSYISDGSLLQKSLLDVEDMTSEYKYLWVQLYVNTNASLLNR